MEKAAPKQSLPDMYRSASQCVVAFINQPARAASPAVFGTGFLVNAKGLVVTHRHVVEELQNGQQAMTSAFLLLLDEAATGCQAIFPPILGTVPMDALGLAGNVHSSSVPDIGFVQLGVMETPFLELNTDEFAIHPGLQVSTIGYPAVSFPPGLHNRVKPISPFIRRGIISSVYPCPVARPDGFTIDVMQQAGAGGSPIFGSDNRRVIGMMWGGLSEPRPLVLGATRGHMSLPINISFAEVAGTIATAMTEVAKQSTITIKEMPTLQAMQDAEKLQVT